MHFNVYVPLTNERCILTLKWFSLVDFRERFIEYLQNRLKHFISCEWYDARQTNIL